MVDGSKVEKRNYFRFYNVLIDKRWWATLSEKAIRIYPVIARYYNPKTQESYPSFSAFEKLGGLRRDAIRSGLDELRECGLIEELPREKRKCGRSMQLVNRYKLVLPIPEVVPEKALPQEKQSSPDIADYLNGRSSPDLGVEVVQPQTQKMPLNSTNINNTKDIEKLFDYFCLKTGKKLKLTEVRKGIIEKRLKDGYDMSQLRQAIDNFIQDDWPDRYKYIDIVYCIGVRNKVDNLEKWLNWKPKNRLQGAAARELK